MQVTCELPSVGQSLAKEEMQKEAEVGFSPRELAFAMWVQSNWAPYKTKQTEKQ